MPALSVVLCPETGSGCTLIPDKCTTGSDGGTTLSPDALACNEILNIIPIPFPFATGSDSHYGRVCLAAGAACA